MYILATVDTRVSEDLLAASRSNRGFGVPGVIEGAEGVG